MTAPLNDNPWATDQPPEPRSLTRDDRIDAVSRVLVDITAHTRRHAARALDAAYPELTTAAELDALPSGAVLIGAGGIAYERVVAPGNTLVRNPERCWAQQAWMKTRVSSVDLVRNGETYVLVHRAAS